MPTDADKITREHVESFIVHLRENRSPATANNRYRALKQFFKWLQKDGEIRETPMAHMEPPPLEETSVPVPDDDDLDKLLATCKGNTLEDRRDYAILCVFIDLGLRLSELADIRWDQYDRNTDVLTVSRKGRKGVVITQQLKLPPESAAAVDRYVRKRPAGAKDREGVEWLWVSNRKQKAHLEASGVYQMVKRRCREAGISEIHPHQLRHFFAHIFKLNGGSDGDLMWLGNWKSHSMIQRYARSTAGVRATAAHQRNSPLSHLKGKR